MNLFHEGFPLCICRKHLGFSYGYQSSCGEWTHQSKYFPKKIVRGTNMIQHADKISLGKVTQASISEQGDPYTLISKRNVLKIRSNSMIVGLFPLTSLSNRLFYRSEQSHSFSFILRSFLSILHAHVILDVRPLYVSAISKFV